MSKLVEAINRVRAAGYRVGSTYHDQEIALAASLETAGPATYGHPLFEVIWHYDGKYWRVYGDAKATGKEE